MSWHVYGCLSLFLIISLLYSWKLYLHVRQKQETVPLEEFLPYVTPGKAVGAGAGGCGGNIVARILIGKVPSPPQRWHCLPSPTLLMENYKE